MSTDVKHTEESSAFFWEAEESYVTAEGEKKGHIPAAC